jgi:hypothetical protein
MAWDDTTLQTPTKNSPEVEEGFVDDESDGVLGVVHQSKRGRRPGVYAQQLGHRVGGGKPVPALHADPGV